MSEGQMKDGKETCAWCGADVCPSCIVRVSMSGNRLKEGSMWRGTIVCAPCGAKAGRPS
jgi:hypothetical protein